MENNNLLIVSPHMDIKKVAAALTSRRTKRWLYLGNDFSALSSIEQKLKDNYELVNIAEIYKKVADDIRNDYVAWIDELNKRYGDEVEWWVSTTFSENNYSNNLFQYACYFEILERLLLEQKILPDVLFVESLGLAQSIKSWAAKKNMQVLINKGSFTIIKVKRIGKAILDWCRFVVISLLCLASALISRMRYGVKKGLFSATVIVHTFLHDYSLSKKGDFSDRYFPFLYEYAANNGFKILVHPILYGFKYSYFSAYLRMRKSSVPIIIKEDFLCPSDYLYVLTYPIRSLRKRIDIKAFRGFDLSNIIKETRHEERFSAGMNALLMYRLLGRLKNTGIDPSLFILWHENQVFDRALIAGMRRYFPKIKIIGAQLFLHAPNFLSQYPVQSEVDFNMSPDVLIEMSEYQCCKATAFTRAIPCRIGAALRYAHVFKDSPDTYPEKHEKAVILVALPFYLPDSIEILTLLNSSLDCIKHKIRVLIKTHPDYTPKILTKRFGESRWPKAFHFYSGGLVEALKKASVVVSTNSSSIVEAATYGIPVIYVGSRVMINQNILKELNMEIAQECYTTSSLAEAIDKYISQYPIKRMEYKEMGRRIREMYFTPINENTIAPFFDKESNVQ